MFSCIFQDGGFILVGISNQIKSLRADRYFVHQPQETTTYNQQDETDSYNLPSLESPSQAYTDIENCSTAAKEPAAKSKHELVYVPKMRRKTVRVTSLNGEIAHIQLASGVDAWASEGLKIALKTNP